jgi:hypothetical protein
MSERHQLEAKIFLRSLKDAQACLYQSVYKDALFQQMRALTQNVRQATQGKSRAQIDALQTSEVFKPFQFADYAYSKYFDGLTPIRQLGDVEKAAKDLDRIELRLKEALNKLG